MDRTARLTFGIIIWISAAGSSLELVGCSRNSGGDDAGAENSICDVAASNCADGLVCDATTDGRAICAVPVEIVGSVLDLADDAAVVSARVQAVDANGAAVGTSGTTAEDGSFTITVPAVRDLDGILVEGDYTLRVQAHAYQEFPTALRPAIPIDVTSATLAASVADGDMTVTGTGAGTDSEGRARWVIEAPQTTVKLIGLPGDTSQLGSIAGTVRAEHNAGLLMVAEGGSRDGDAAALTGFSDSAGDYVIFNVLAGTYTVQGYAAGVQLNAVATAVEGGEQAVGVNLDSSDRPTSSVSGNLQIVNAPGGSITSVVLAVESTFNETAAKGTVPPGLRVGEVEGAFRIDGVPDGRYVVLAAFENDALVRDPDQSIGGTDIVRITVPDASQGNAISISEGFKVTGALAISGPGSDGPEEIAADLPVFEWEDDSSEDGYVLRVFDAFGNDVWSDEVGAVTGSSTVTHTYAGPELEAGMLYQFRVTSFREGNNGSRTNISASEDLKGVFIFVPTALP